MRRVTVRRDASARCIQCGLAWTDPLAISHGTQHAEAAGHVIEANYSAAYVYVPTASPGSGNDRTERLRRAVLDYLAVNPGAGVRSIQTGVGGCHARLREVLVALVASGDLVVLDGGPGRSRAHYRVGQVTA